jgi:ADP-heptose:LPS heptosyltransferase
MHLIESYALVSGLHIDKCYIQEEEIELPEKPYITLHPYNPKGSGRQYGSWHDVVKMLQSDPSFEYDIVQIGMSSDIKFSINTSYLGKTNYNSLAYLIKNSELHLGFDSLPVHLASHYDKKIVAIYAQYYKNTGPYFSSKENIRMFEPSQYTSLKPIFQYEDPYRLINIIPAKDIFNAVMDLCVVKK